MTTRRTLLAAAAAGAAAAAMPIARAATTLTMSNWLPPGHPVANTMLQWARTLEQSSSGRIRIQALPKAVASPAGHYNAVRDGLADISFAVLGYTPGRFTLSEFSELPLGSDTAEQSSVALQRIAQKYPAIMNEYREVKVLALFAHGPGVIFNMKKPIGAVDDMKGLKFRVGGGIVNEVACVLEVNSTLKPANETYELLSTGVMDGTWLPFEAVATFKLDKLLKYATTFPGGLYSSAFIAIMNRKAYDALAAEDRAAIDKESGEGLSRQLGRAFDGRDREGRALATVNGMKIQPAPQAMVQDVAARIGTLEKGWFEAARAKGLANPEAVLKDFRAEGKKT